MRRRIAAGAFIGAHLLTATNAVAAEFVVETTDAPNQGFNDPAPPHAASADGGNPGATLGEQRRQAFQFAADVWGALLESPVPVRISASMSDLECSSGGAVLGAAAPTSFFNYDGTGLWYPSALADALSERDLEPRTHDIIAHFNANLDRSNCLGSSGWYYGLDGLPPSGDMDFVSVVLHELGHGLGVLSMVDYDTGAFIGNGRPDAYSAWIYDLTQQKRWTELSASERVASVRNVRNLVWDGPRVTAASTSELAPGYPVVITSPAVSGFKGAVNETNLGPTALNQSVEGRLIEISNACNVPRDLSGAVVLVRALRCLGVDQAAEYGAVGALVDVGRTDSPPGDLDLDLSWDISIPTLHVSRSDADALSAALASGSVTVSISATEARVGADGDGRLLINATDPIQEGSSIAHWDSLTRRTASLEEANRDLLMEPSGVVAGTQIDITAHLLHDLGWNAKICGDGVPSSSEECDDGENNSNTRPNACRLNCVQAHCGDGVTDEGETCDAGPINGTAASGCSSSCTANPCGDGVRNGDEECDDGVANSDVTPDACRTSCRLPICGDGVIDAMEECDDGAANSASTPDACRVSCRRAYCGDGVTDSGEACDDGNTDDADDCSNTCTRPPPGANVPNAGNTTPPTSSSAPNPVPTPSPTTAPAPTVVSPSTSGNAMPHTPAPSGDDVPVTNDGGLGAESNSGSGLESGCGCQVPGSRSASTLGGLGWLGLALLALRRRSSAQT